MTQRVCPVDFSSSSNPQREGSLCARNMNSPTATRGAALKQPGKTRITIMLNRDIVSAFRARAADSGRGYQTVINHALREFPAADELEDTLRRVVREELKRTG